MHRVPGLLRIIIVAIEAILAFALGIIIIVNPRAFNRQSIIIIGVLLIIYGFFKVIGELFAQRKTAMPKSHR